jgi:hypothetical protein
MFNTAIDRITSGPINKVNDAVVGMPAAPFGPGLSKFAGQLGAGFWVDDANVLYDSTVGVVYGGHFRYVRLSAAAAAVIRGQIVFWDTLANAADNLFQVTTAENGSADAAMLHAGIVLNPAWTPGNYSIIQDWGPVYVKFRAALTSAGAAGSRAFCAAVGGGDLGKADVVDSATAATIANISQMLGRYLGVCQEAPGNGSLSRVYLSMANLRG